MAGRGDPRAVGGAQPAGVRRGPGRAPAAPRPAAVPPGRAHRAARPVRPAGRRAGRLRQLVLDRRRPGQHPLAAGRATTVSSPWWSSAQLGASCADTRRQSSPRACRHRRPGWRWPGLAVTTHHYLAAGYVAADEQGLLLFDLQAGGAPMRLLWPAPFSPVRPGRHARRRPARPRPPKRRATSSSMSTSASGATSPPPTGPFCPAAGGPPESFTGQAFP